VDRYSAEGRYDRIPAIAQEVVATKPDVIFALGDLVVLALKSETRTIPIVGWTTDPVLAGIVSNIARPGGNVTGVSIVVGADFWGKPLQLFVDAVGKLSNARVLETPEPKLRYVIGRDARMAMLMRKVLPAGVFERLMVKLSGLDK